MSRLIRIIGEINEEAFKSFSEQMQILENKVGLITVELSSDGGNAYDALAFVGRIRQSECNVQIIAYGLVASAAVLILAAGDYRYLAKEAWVMVHEDSAKLNGDVMHLERETAHMRAMEEQWARLLEDYTGTEYQIWRQLHKDCAYLTANDCVRYKLVDGVI